MRTLKACEICGKTEDGRNTVTEIFGNFPPCPRCGKKTAGKGNKMHTEHYTLAYRLGNRKLTAVAGISFEGRTCLRAAELEFQKNGFATCGKYSVYYTNQLTNQKNYIGKAPVYTDI